jgi:hypothetical protein
LEDDENLLIQNKFLNYIPKDNNIQSIYFYKYSTSQFYFKIDVDSTGPYYIIFNIGIDSSQSYIAFRHNETIIKKFQ